jgi:hypothetical protein
MGTGTLEKGERMRQLGSAEFISIVVDNKNHRVCLVSDKRDLDD